MTTDEHLAKELSAKIYESHYKYYQQPIFHGRIIDASKVTLKMMREMLIFHGTDMGGMYDLNIFNMAIKELDKIQCL